MHTSSVYSMTSAWILRIAAQSDYLLCSLRNRGGENELHIVIVHLNYLVNLSFRAPFDHLTSSSTQTRPDIRRPIREEERATRSNTSGNSGDQSPAPPAGRVQVSVRVSDMNLLKAIFISNLVTPLKRMSSVAASGRYRRQSTRGHPHRYSKRHRSADASRCVVKNYGLQF